MPGQILDVKCYLEGIEVPLEGGTIDITFNQSSTATISIPPTLKATRIRPKTRVHLFWLDDASRDWILLWEGEVLSIGHSKDPSSRSMELQCADMSNYLDFTKKSLMNLSTGVPFLNEVIYYGNTSSVISASNDLLVEKVWLAMKNKGNLPDALYSLLAELGNEVPFYREVESRNRLHRQIALVNDTNSERLLDATQLQALTQNMTGWQGDNASIREVINAFASLVNYSYSPVGSPSYVSRLDQRSSDSYSWMLASFLMIPNLFGCLPPKCNVLFPDTTSSLKYRQSFMSEPTRMRCKAQPIAGVNTNGAPSLLTRMAPSYLMREIMDAAGSGNAKKDALRTYSSEEMEKGIIAQDIALPFPEAFAMSGQHSDKQDDYVQKYVDYIFQMSRYASRQLSFSSPLNPWLACGFPCAVFDASISYFARIVSISHSFGGSQGGYTHVQCDLARPIDPDNDDSPFIDTSWFCEAYKHENVSDTYQALLGCGAMGSGAFVQGGKEEQENVSSGAAYNRDTSARVNTSKVASEVYNSATEKSMYHDAVRANAAYQFSDSYRRRSIATMRDTFLFYGISDVGSYPPAEFDGDIFSYPSSIDGITALNGDNIVTASKYKREKVQDYVAELNESRVLDGR